MRLREPDAGSSLEGQKDYQLVGAQNVVAGPRPAAQTSQQPLPVMSPASVDTIMDAVYDSGADQGDIQFRLAIGLGVFEQEQRGNYEEIVPGHIGRNDVDSNRDICCRRDSQNSDSRDRCQMEN